MVVVTLVVEVLCMVDTGGVDLSWIVGGKVLLANVAGLAVDVK